MRPFFVISILLFFFTLSAFAQNKVTFGKLTAAEKSMTIYEKNPSASAVVLYERGDNYFKVINYKVYLVKEFHRKIKVLNEKNFDGGSISVSLYHKGQLKEKLTELKAITHNGDNQQEVLESQIYTSDLTENIELKKFTFPDIHKGSILEYKYTLISPFNYKLTGWLFQSEYPMLYSEFNAKIPGKYVYNRAFFGNLKLDVNEAKIQKSCFSVNNSYRADCEVLKYVMKDIPAFKSDSDYMLASKNYISRIEFELAELTYFDGSVEKKSTTWKQVDEKFKEANGIGFQLNRKTYFKKRVPQSIMSEKNKLIRAQKIFSFTQGHFTCNGSNGTYALNNVKQAYYEKAGSVAEINMALINLLNAADIKAKLMLLSTRDNGLPKKNHPVIYDFNYFMAKINIDGKDYLLDASSKHNIFGMVPFKALNHYGRVMDFEGDSYWFDIDPYKKNLYQIRARLEFDPNTAAATGIMDVINTGYNAVNRKQKINETSEDEYLEELELGISDDFVIDDYELLKERSDKERISERIKFESDNLPNADHIYLNPFFIRFFESNPFKLAQRDYPIDFGFPRNYKYQINIAIPSGYSIVELPKSKAINLGDSMANLKFYTQQNENQVALTFELKLNATYFRAEDYDSLKSLFKEAVDLQKNSLVVLKKKTAQP
jgi:hypothetical protein